MSRKSLPERAKEKVVVLACEGMRNKDIAESLDISEPSVARLLKEAEEPAEGEKRLIDRTPRMLNIDERLKEELRQEVLSGNELKEQLRAVMEHGETLQNVLVLPNYDRSFYGACARFLVDHVFRQHMTAAVAWGATLADIVHEIEQMPGLPLLQDGRFIQAHGDPTYSIGRLERSSEYVARLNTAVFGTDTNDFVFSFPAMIPGDFKPTELRTIRKYLMTDPGYSAVFESRNESDRPRLKLNVDVLLTSCGNASKEEPWSKETALTLGSPAKREAFFDAVVGNICGVWLARDDRRVPVVEETNKRWNGVTREDLESIASKGRVVVVAKQARKARAMIELTRRGLATDIVVSQEVANAILDQKNFL